MGPNFLNVSIISGDACVTETASEKCEGEWQSCAESIGRNYKGESTTGILQMFELFQFRYTRFVSSEKIEFVGKKKYVATGDSYIEFKECVETMAAELGRHRTSMFMLVNRQ